MRRLPRRAIITIACIAGVSVLAVIALIGFPSRDHYGREVAYTGRTLEYPDLCLRFISRHEDPHFTATAYDFDILDRSDSTKVGSFTYYTSGVQMVQSFRFRGRWYLAEMYDSMRGMRFDEDFRKKEKLPEGMIIIWDESTAREQNPVLVKEAEEQEALVKGRR